MQVRHAVNVCLAALGAIVATNTSMSADQVTRAYLDVALSIRDPYRDTTRYVPPCDGEAMKFALYTEKGEGELIWEEALECVHIESDGYVEVLLGQSSIFSTEIPKTYDVLYLEVTLADRVVEPRFIVVFSEYAIFFDASGSETGTPASTTDSTDVSQPVYSSGQHSLGAIGITRDPIRPRILIFGNSRLSRSERIVGTKLPTNVSSQLFEQQTEILKLRDEIAKLKK